MNYLLDDEESEPIRLIDALLVVVVAALSTARTWLSTARTWRVG